MTCKCCKSFYSAVSYSISSINKHCLCCWKIFSSSTLFYYYYFFCFPSYFIICPSFQLARGYRWIERHLPSDGSVKFQNVTHLYGGLNVVGPRAREVLQKLTETSLKLSEFKPFMCTVSYRVYEVNKIKWKNLGKSFLI